MKLRSMLLRKLVSGAGAWPFGVGFFRSMFDPMMPALAGPLLLRGCAGVVLFPIVIRLFFFAIVAPSEYGLKIG
jgi:hypothetical protein